jgi:hypothetical protein
MFKFNQIDLTDLIAIIALSAGFVLSIIYGMNELSMSIATGFFGYIGGVYTGSQKNGLKNTDPSEQYKQHYILEDISPSKIIRNTKEESSENTQNDK